MSRDFVYLASGSPRRRELLAQIGVAYQVLRVEVDESIEPGEAALAYVTRLARAKAQAGAAKAREEAPGIAADAAVLGADTAVVVDAAILGKPTDEEDGVRMLQLLSGRSHEVLTAVAVATPAGVSSRVSASEVTFRVIAAEEASAYWRSAEPWDKAGGYAIQGYGAVFVASLKGSHSGVMGLPLFETAELLHAAGVARRFEPRTRAP